MILAEFQLSDLVDYFQELNTNHSLLARALVFWSAFLIGFLVNLLMGAVFKKLFVVLMRQKGTIGPDETLRMEKVSKRLANLCFIATVYTILAYMNINVYMIAILRRVCQILTVILLTMIVMHWIHYFESWYNRQPGAQNRPIKGGIQLLRIFVFICALILCISILLGKTPIYLLSGLGCVAAVLMLVFQDTLLALVSGIQLSADKLVRVGDWIVIPSEEVDGEVTDISLHTIKVRLWDQTIVAVPVRKLTQGSFINYRNMFEMGGRRIKRSIHIDIHSIRFLSDEEVQNLEQYPPLHDYIQAKKKKQMETPQEGVFGKNNKLLSGTNITNIGVFRMYVEYYLKSLSTINQGMMLLVRQMQSQSTGLPIEIYCFSASTKWKDYEGIQAEILEHIFAILPEFGLKVYQRSSDAPAQE